MLAAGGVGAVLAEKVLNPLVGIRDGVNSYVTTFFPSYDNFLMKNVVRSGDEVFRIGNAKVEVSASIGYARYPHGGTEFANTIQISEEMMYADKKMIGEER